MKISTSESLNIKSAIIRNTMISSAIALAMSMTAANLHANQEPASGEINPPTAGQELVDDIDRAAADHDLDRTDEVKTEVEEFVETASAKLHAAMNTAQLALEQGVPALHVYARKIIEDHTVTNNELRAVAARIDIYLTDDDAVMDRARDMELSVGSEESFEDAFIENQIAAHQESIELFERAANSGVPEVRAYARGKLPALQEHLQMAKALKTQLSGV
ncbi:MAG: DUF4142 domain-containing protein [Pseudohongiella sp.]|nr:DUF4142 domain-containing protein [Pseudohongiella sp.]